MRISGVRQDYVFKAGVTYFIDSNVQLLGTTIIRGGAVIKFDPDSASSLTIMGEVVCDALPYLPAVLTSRNDNNGMIILPGSNGQPERAANGVAYSTWIQPIAGL